MKKRKLNFRLRFPAGSGSPSYTVRRQRTGDLCAVFLFLLLLPYICSILIGRDAYREADSLFRESAEGISIRVKTANGNYRMELEEYLVGALAAVIPADYDEETLKAQAVILRTLCIREWEQSLTEEVESENIVRNYPDRRQLEVQWGKNCEDNLNRIRRAVEETTGKYISCKGRTAEPSYFRLSAGQTRDGETCLGEGYSFMKSVECPGDSFAPDCRQEIRIREEQFWNTLHQERRTEISLERDSAGYVQWIHIGGEQMAGEEFRRRFGLNSAHFTIKSEKTNVIFTCMGIGHGFGFCQYDADRRAKEGADFETLLKIYFQGIEIKDRTV